MSGFVGRTQELAALAALLDEARTRQGVLVSMRGRRQVGKSRLVSEFTERAGVPAIYFTASQQPLGAELEQFGLAARQAEIATAEAIGAGARTWEVALDLATSDATRERPVIVVIDELPYLAASDPAFEAILQKVWHALERRPVLMILIGSDLAMMEALTTHGRPLYGRAREIVVRPLSVYDIAHMTGLAAAPAFDAYTVIGGFPRLATRWRGKDSVLSFVRREFSDESSPFVVLGERMVSAELPADLGARAVLTAIGAGERGHGAIMSRSGVGRGPIDKTLGLLIAKRVVERSTPYAEPGSPKLPRYTVVDPYLRFWLRFIQPSIDLISRGRTDLAVERFESGWIAFRGRAIEPLIRESIERLLPHKQFGDARFVGSYWTKDHRVEIDLVGGRQQHRAETVDFVGSVKWRERSPFDRRDVGELAVGRAAIPGATSATRLIGVSRSGFSDGGLDVEIGPDALLAAWAP